ncbi:hypothetical protein Tco_0672779 [Tanacetum coccineum]
MLEKGMYDSWKTRIWLYIKGKENGEMLIDSIVKGPFKLKEEITIPEKRRYDCDIEATNIILLGLPVDIYTLINHFQTAKEICDRVKELMEGTELTLQERESKLYDEFDGFTFEPEESVHSYYLWYAKLINDMNIIKMTMTPIQVNTKFVNHLQPEWSQFATAAKQAKDLHNVNFDQFTSMNLNFPPANNQLTTLSNLRTQASVHDRRVTVQSIQGCQSQGYGSIVIRCYNYKGEGHIGKQCTAKKKVKDAEWFKKKMLLAQAQEAGVILHKDQQDFLADRLEEMDDCDDLQLHTTSNFKADHVDAYYSDCDDEAIAYAIFMASLSPTGHNMSIL